MTEPLDARRIAAVAALWQRDRHEVVTSFAGDSMRPSIAPGESLRLRFGDVDDYDIGDVVMAISEPYIIVHRLVACGRSWVLMQGDNTLLPDPPAARSQVVARVIEGARAFHKGRRIRSFLQSLTIAATRIHPRVGRMLIVALRVLARGVR